jgi:hypothetical protein
MEINSEVLIRGEAVFNMAGSLLYYPLRLTDSKVSKTLEQRLVAYAKKTLVDEGFTVPEQAMVTASADPYDLVNDRTYEVAFITPQGGRMGVYGIMLKDYRPILDRGLFIDRS